MSFGQIDRQQQTDDTSGKKLNPTKFTSQERNRLLRGLSDEELNSVEYDTTVYGTSLDGESGSSGVKFKEEEDSMFEGDSGECDYWEPDSNSMFTTEQELREILSLKTCNNLPEKIKDKKNIDVEIKKSVGEIDGKTRIKIEIKNNDTENCAFIESIRVITGTSNSSEYDSESYPSIVKNSALNSEDEILTFVNSKLQITDITPSSFLDGISSNIPECLNSLNDSIGIVVGPKNEDQSGNIVTGQMYRVNQDLPAGADNLIGIIGSTGGRYKKNEDGTINYKIYSKIDVHIHAEWGSVGSGTPKYWNKDEFARWFRSKYNKDPNMSIIKYRDYGRNGRGGEVFPGSNGKSGVAAYFTVNDLLKFIDVDMLPLKDQIEGKKTPIPATANDFLFDNRTLDRNYAQDRTTRYHYAIDVNPKGETNYNGKCGRRMFLKPGVRIISAGGSGDGSTGNSALLRHPDGNEILLYHMAAIWDPQKKVYYTHSNPALTLKPYGGGPAVFGRNDISK